jgi:hypothetical protein
MQYYHNLSIIMRMLIITSIIVVMVIKLLTIKRMV